MATLVLCIPGDWEGRSDLMARIIRKTNGDFMFLGLLLAQPSQSRHVRMDLEGHTESLGKAFQIAGQGKLSPELLDEVGKHRSVAYLQFDNSVMENLSKIVEFSRLMQSVGGIAVKVESSGVAHDWDTWLGLMNSERAFDHYRAVVTLVGDEDYFFSCGMHHFELPDVEVPSDFDAGEAADLMNQFNLWQIVKKPELEGGHTFSLSAESQRFRLSAVKDGRHEEDNFFFNPGGLWRMDRV